MSGNTEKAEKTIKPEKETTLTETINSKKENFSYKSEEKPDKDTNKESNNIGSYPQLIETELVLANLLINEYEDVNSKFSDPRFVDLAAYHGVQAIEKTLKYLIAKKLKCLSDFNIPEICKRHDIYFLYKFAKAKGVNLPFMNGNFTKKNLFPISYINQKIRYGKCPPVDIDIVYSILDIANTLYKETISKEHIEDIPNLKLVFAKETIAQSGDFAATSISGDISILNMLLYKKDETGNLYSSKYPLLRNFMIYYSAQVVEKAFSLLLNQKHGVPEQKIMNMAKTHNIEQMHQLILKKDNQFDKKNKDFVKTLSLIKKGNSFRYNSHFLKKKITISGAKEIKHFAFKVEQETIGTKENQSDETRIDELDEKSKVPIPNRVSKKKKETLTNTESYDTI